MCSQFYCDEDFPPNDTSLGKVGGDTANANSGRDDSDVEWRRLGDFKREKRREDTDKPRIHDTDMQLFEGNIEAQDVLQGALGDCWLLASMAILAEREGVLEDVFITREVDPRGKYTVKLFDVQKKEWVTVTVDDYVPCLRGREDAKSGMPVQKYCKCHNAEVWACILEKAVAKFCGGYAAIEAGHTEWGLMALTGKQAFRYILSDQKWNRTKIVGKVNEEDPSDKRDIDIFFMPEKHDSNTFFEILRRYHAHGAVMCVQGTNDAGEKMGLVKGHAFSILDVQEVSTTVLPGSETLRMIKCRNPWGTGEWKGRWSDNAEQWSAYPHVKSQLISKDEAGVDDGIYWMQWEDFIQYWTSVGVVDMDFDIYALHPPVYNDKDIFGPLKSCLKGTLQYCCCKGLHHLLVARKASGDTEIDVEQQEGCIVLDPRGLHLNCCKGKVASIPEKHN